MSGSMSFVPPTAGAHDDGPHEGQTLLDGSQRSPDLRGSPTLVPLASGEEDITGLGASNCTSPYSHTWHDRSLPHDADLSCEE